MPTRIQRRRTPGWRLPPNTVIVDRTSRFGNPFRIASAIDAFGVSEGEARTIAVTSFEPWLAGSRREWPSHEADLKRERILANLHLLRGRDIACTCRVGDRCHGDTLMEWANLPEGQLAARILRARQAVDRDRVRRGEPPLYAEAVTR